MDVQEFHKDFLEEVKATAATEGSGSNAAFVSVASSYLVNAEVLSDFTAAFYLGKSGSKKLRVDGYVLDEFEYLISAGIALNVQAISNPVFPLIESSGKNLLKLYLNDVGILTGILYGNNIRAVLDDERSINLGSVYESVVASELAAHGHKLFYYDNRSKGEVDYLIDDYDSLSAVPIEVKSGKDYTIHSALNNFVKNEDYHIKKAFVVSNERTIKADGKITYLPIYYVMFF